MANSGILVVEDEALVAEEIRGRLKRMEYKVAGVAFSGEEAVAKAERTHPDLVLMDIRLKGEMDGVEAAERIRERFDIPVVYVTAYADDDTLRRAKETTPYAYVLKPFEDRELRSNIEVALHKHALEKELRASEQWLASMLTSIGDVVIAIDAQGRVAYMNPVAEELTGQKQGDVEGQSSINVFKVVNEQMRKAGEDPVMKAIREGSTVSLPDSIIVTGGGEEVPVSGTAAPIKNDSGETTGVVLVFQDTSARRRIEEELAGYRHHLENLVQERTAELKTSNERRMDEIIEHRRAREKLEGRFKQEREIRQRLEADIKEKLESTKDVAHSLQLSLAHIMVSCKKLASGLSDETQQRIARDIVKGISDLRKRIDQLVERVGGEADTDS